MAENYLRGIGLEQEKSKDKRVHTDKLGIAEGLESQVPVPELGGCGSIIPTASLGNFCLISLDRGDCYQKARKEVPSGTV